MVLQSNVIRHCWKPNPPVTFYRPGWSSRKAEGQYRQNIPEPMWLERSFFPGNCWVASLSQLRRQCAVIVMYS